jgi:hypothetical protein
MLLSENLLWSLRYLNRHELRNYGWRWSRVKGLSQLGIRLNRWDELFYLAANQFLLFFQG